MDTAQAFARLPGRADAVAAMTSPVFGRPTVDVVESPAGGSPLEWDEFVASQELGSFYHCYGWKALNERQLRHASLYLEARAGGTLTGILPLVLTRSRLFGNILCSLPFVNFGGPVAVDLETTNELVRAAQSRASRLGVDYLELRCAESLETDMIPSLHKISMTLHLDPDPDRLWNGFTSKHRTAIRRVYKDGLTVISGGAELLPEFYSVMQDSWRDLGTPLYSPEYFQAILETFPEQTRVFVCRRDGQPVAVALNGYFAGTVEGMWAGTTQAGHDLHANYVLYWEMIKDACERGFRRYHLGRSTAGSGAEQFKKKWNAEATQLYWYYHRPSGREVTPVNVNHPTYQLGIAVWRKLPLWVTRRVGPSLARVIP
jgi:FemAB-related protein (PEP-CTERM system-associated)